MYCTSAHGIDVEFAPGFAGLGTSCQLSSGARDTFKSARFEAEKKTAKDDQGAVIRDCLDTVISQFLDFPQVGLDHLLTIAQSRPATQM